MKINYLAYSPLGVTQLFAKKTEKKDKATNGTHNASLNISEEGKEKAKRIKEEQEKMAAELEMIQRQLESMRSNSKAEADALKVRVKCLIIAIRIIKGDEVPNEDYRYLAENDPGLYMKAVSLRMENEKPEKHKRLSEDEESDNSLNISSGSIQSDDGVVSVIEIEDSEE